MNIHWVQHAEFEGLGCVAPWLEASPHQVSCTRLWAGEELPQVSNQLVGQASLYSESLCLSCKQEHTRSRIREACSTIKTKQFHYDTPSISDIDGLIVMGGPMGIYDNEQYPWLAAEKAFIREVIAQNKPVLGICLGAQLIADCLGSKVWKNEHKEIGFFPVSGRDNLKPGNAGSNDWKLPDEFLAFHWHGDTFGIPDGAVRLASSEATQNQAFVYKDNVLALQFHLETTKESLLKLYENCAGEITAAPFIQTLEATALRLANENLLATCNDLMRKLLGSLFHEESQLTNNE